MTADPSYLAATIRAQEAKARFKSSAQDAKARIAPARLKADVKDKIKGATRTGATRVATTVKDQPVAFGAAGAALVLFLARRPITALLRRIYVRIRNADSQSLEIDHG